MAAELILAPEAELDIADACLWYENRRAGLGDEFLSAIDASMERIRRQPEVFPVVHEAYRRALVRRFPYAIFFEFEGVSIAVYALFHTARDPAKWRQRLA